MKIGDRIYVRGYVDEIRKDTVIVRNDGGYFGTVLSEVTGELPSAQPERPKDIIQNFHDYQVEWLKSHCDIELEPELEMLIVRFLNDTANCYIMEIERQTG